MITRALYCHLAFIATIRQVYQPPTITTSMVLAVAIPAAGERPAIGAVRQPIAVHMIRAVQPIADRLTAVAVIHRVHHQIDI